MRTFFTVSRPLRGSSWPRWDQGTAKALDGGRALRGPRAPGFALAHPTNTAPVRGVLRKSCDHSSCTGLSVPRHLLTVADESHHQAADPISEHLPDSDQHQGRSASLRDDLRPPLTPARQPTEAPLIESVALPARPTP